MAQNHANHAIAMAMEERGLSSTELANAVGVSTASISNWLRGSKPNRLTRPKLAKFLGIDEAELVSNGESPADVNAGIPEGDIPLGNGAPITVKITGEGLLLEMTVSKTTARSLLHMLLND
jgi:transcriptional regulator with XRE-family HTH domain